ncbi:substrate-binding periplasmic protein [Roseateles koreensis]|uniref:Transporter substrate-binding domain-containing protein n=1 Tax=Roseateles koreensis TaxID=2987526 RepID=A0ABT5KW40_9BURK|nr:transporter substrate-binding domain-containing protein [Roseateles koreensis]MDC8787164.1 transporter substrate-binding domain-containing protein [Roseateles koreensis]
MNAQRRAWLARAASAALLAHFAGPAEATSLSKIRERGTLRVGIYQDMPPFHVAGLGVDVDLAQALAQALGVKLSLLPFNADENMLDDLRNMVWKGHYLGYGPADVLMHVPVDRPLMDACPQVQILAPYYRERVMIARDVHKLPRLEQLSQIGTQTIAVPGQTLAGWLLLGADQGAYRQQLSTQWPDGCACAQALQRGEVAAAAGLASELQSILRDQPQYAIEALPLPRLPREGWAIGLAVKAGETELARTLQEAVSTLSQTGSLRTLFEAHKVGWTPV